MKTFKSEIIFIGIEEKSNLKMVIAIALSISLSGVVFVFLCKESPKVFFNAAINAGFSISVFWGLLLITTLFILDRKSPTHLKDLAAISLYLIFTSAISLLAYLAHMNLPKGFGL